MAAQPVMPAPAGPLLVVDDDEAVRRALKFALELEGYEVRLYEDGAHLLGEAGLPRAGCLVVDYHMLGMDGVELVGRLRGLLQQRPLPPHFDGVGAWPCSSFGSSPCAPATVALHEVLSLAAS